MIFGCTFCWDAATWTAIFTAIIAIATIRYVTLTSRLWRVALKTLDQKMPFITVEELPFGNLVQGDRVMNYETGLLGIKLKNYGDSPAVKLKIDAGYFYEKELNKRIGFIEESDIEIPPNAIFFCKWDIKTEQIEVHHRGLLPLFVKIVLSYESVNGKKYSRVHSYSFDKESRGFTMIRG